MNTTSLLLAAALAVLLLWAVRRTLLKARRGGGCCGEHEETLRRRPVPDRSRTNYPYTVSLQIGGMTCENCARKAENALNSLDGVWAEVSISSRSATVRCKEMPDEKRIREAVRQTGYVVTEYTLR